MPINSSKRSSSTAMMKPDGTNRAHNLTAKQNSIIAAKIKTKIANTSSFFKVSLKTNNRALALALVAQKEKTRQLENEVVLLRKEVENLCFNLSVRRHKQRQLVRILKDLQSSTLNNLAAAVDLLSKEDDVSDFDEDTNEQFPLDSDETSTRLGGKALRVPVQCVKSHDPEGPVPQQRLTQETGKCDSVELKKSSEVTPGIATLPESKLSEGIFCDVEASENVSSLQERTLQPSTNLQQALDRWSTFYIDTVPKIGRDAADSTVIADSTNGGLSSPSVHDPSNSLTKHLIKTPGKAPYPECTILCDTEMELTIGDNAAKIDAVETRPKIPQKTGEFKLRQKEEAQASVSSFLGKEKKKVQDNKAAHRVECPKGDKSALVTETENSEPDSCALFNPCSPGCEREEVQTRVFDSVAARRKTHVTCRNTRHHRRTSEVPKQSRGADSSIAKALDSAVPWDRHGQSHLVGPPEGDYFRDIDVQSFGLNKEIPRNAAVKMDKTAKLNSNLSDTFLRRMYITSDESTYNCSPAISRRTKTLPVMVGDSLHLNGCCNQYFTCESQQDASVDVENLQSQNNSPKESQLVKGSKQMGLIQNDSQVSSKHRRATVYESNGAVKSMEHLLTEESCSCEFLTCSFNVATKPKERKKSKQPTARTKKKVQQDDSDGKERLKTNCLHGEQAVTLSEIQNVASHHQEQQAEQLVNVNRAMISEPSLNSAISRRTYIVCLNEGNGFIGSQENSEATDMPVANSDCSDLEKYSSLTRNEAFQDVGLSNRTILPNTAGSNSSVMSHRRQKLRSQDTCVSKSQRGSAVNRKGNVFPDDVQTYVPVNGEQATAPILSGGHVSTEELRQDGGFVANAEQDTGVPREASKKLIIEERPSWEDFDTSFMPCSDWPVHMESRASSSCQKPASPKVPLKSEPVAHKASEGKALKSLTNTNWEVMSDSGRSRRNRGTVSYKEPSINCKMRRGDKFTDTKFLSSPIFKDKKKLKKRIPQQKADDSLIADLCIGYMD